MNTAQIHRALESNHVTRSTFRGVYSSDTVPVFATYPSGCVVNTDPAGQPGTHWVALYQEKPGVMETFDSFGKDFCSYTINLPPCRLITQCHQLQSDSSTVCGQFCMFFLLRRASGETYSHILHLFTDHKLANDIMVCQYVNHYFDIRTEVQDQRFINQVAKMLTEIN